VDVAVAVSAGFTGAGPAPDGDPAFDPASLLDDDSDPGEPRDFPVDEVAERSFLAQPEPLK
jgi:hypothetical protein